MSAMAPPAKRKFLSSLDSEPPLFVAYDNYLAMHKHVIVLTDIIQQIRDGLIEEGSTKLAPVDPSEIAKQAYQLLEKSTRAVIERALVTLYRHVCSSRFRPLKLQFSSKSERDTFLKGFNKIKNDEPLLNTIEPKLRARRDLTRSELETLRASRKKYWKYSRYTTAKTANQQGHQKDESSEAEQFNKIIGVANELWLLINGILAGDGEEKESGTDRWNGISDSDID
ncbi:hypothetical protein L5515_017299 [Caenorhabditis briggsae]|uniref:Uncharacterized protein n=1 Tax=Caenorhabditis briggsae TaxID=6238 RepID=A0AAE9JQN3_CAEBR|nr:hypothetical protein L5515_017299 [Caenorhabditis briggsae]